MLLILLKWNKKSKKLNFKDAKKKFNKKTKRKKIYGKMRGKKWKIVRVKMKKKENEESELNNVEKPTFRLQKILI
jgi:hypothetical protein